MNARLPGGTSIVLTEKNESGSVRDLFTEDFKVGVVWQEFDLAHSAKGSAASEDYLMGRLTPTIFGSIKESKPAKFEVVRVIGGGENPQAAVEFKSTATSLKGKPWVHERVILMRFTDNGKISEVKTYFDTLHLQNRTTFWTAHRRGFTGFLRTAFEYALLVSSQACCGDLE